MEAPFSLSPRGSWGAQRLATVAGPTWGATSRAKRTLQVLAVTLLVLVVALPVRFEMRAPGLTQDEGLLLVYSAELQGGGVANRTFQSVYGPATYLAVDAAFLVAGDSQTAERTVGLLYELVLVGSVAVLVGRRRGVVVGCLAGLFPAMLEVNIGLAAYAWMGALASAALGIALYDAARHRDHAPDRVGIALTTLAGCCFGWAVSYRIDFLVPLGLLLVPLLIERLRLARWLVVGALVGMTALIVNLVQAGVSAVWRGEVVQPVFVTASGRFFPLDTVSAAVLAVVAIDVAGAVALTVAGAMAWRRRHDSWDSCLMFAVGLFDLGLLPQSFQRMDPTHMTYVSGVILGSLLLLPVPRRLLLAAAVALISLSGPGNFTSVALHSVWARSDPRFVVSNNGRSFIVASKSDERDLAGLLRAVDERTAPGTKVFVGPSDLRRTNYNDTFLYFLLPALNPGSYYLEMDPGVANSATSRLASDIAGDQLLVLTDRYNGWGEPNASRHFGSPNANRVVARDFHAVGRWGPWSLLVRNT